MKTLWRDLLLSTAVRMPANEGAADGADPVPLSLADAMKTLDPAKDEHWTAEGLPRMSYIESLVGDPKPTRADVDAFNVTRAALQPADPAPAPEPAPEPAPTPAPPAEASSPVSPPVPSVGRIVIVTVPGGFDGADMAPAIVTRVLDGMVINAKVFAPNGGADAGFTGIQHVSALEAMTDPADKNVATWDWPART